VSSCSFCGRGDGVVARLIANGPGTALICNECVDVMYTLHHEKDALKAVPPVQPAPLKPCDVPCPKCGSMDILRRFHRGGTTFRDDTHRDEPSTPFVDRARSPWDQSALQDCIIHHCRHCQFSWDSAPLGTPT